MVFDLKKLQDFIGIDENVFTYLHNTPKKDNADAIMREGFKWMRSLSKTADNRNPQDDLDMRMWNKDRSIYGPYTVIIQVGKDLMKRYSSKHMLPESLLSKDRHMDGEEGEWIYTMQPEYIKGYFDRIENVGCKNTNFNPYHDDIELAMSNAKKFIDFQFS